MPSLYIAPELQQHALPQSGNIVLSHDTYDIPSLRNCPVQLVLLQAFYLANGMYHIIARDPVPQVKNDSRLHGISLTTVTCQACIMRPSCTSTLSLIRAISYCLLTWISVKHGLNPSSPLCSNPITEKVFKYVPHSSNVFQAYPLGEARQSIIGSVQMELAGLPDVQRKTNTAIDEITKPIADHYSSISPATSHALQSYLPYRTAVPFSGISITLSLLSFTISFTLFHRQRKHLFL